MGKLVSTAEFRQITNLFTTDLNTTLTIIALPRLKTEQLTCLIFQKQTHIPPNLSSSCRLAKIRHRNLMTTPLTKNDNNMRLYDRFHPISARVLLHIYTFKCGLFFPRRHYQYFPMFAQYIFYISLQKR